MIEQKRALSLPWDLGTEFKKSVELKTFYNLCQIIVSGKSFQSEYFETSITKKVLEVLQLLSQRTTMQQPILSMMKMNNRESISYLQQSGDENQRKVLLSYIGLYPHFYNLSEDKIKLPKIATIVSNYEGNPFWILSQNILWQKLGGQQYKDLKKNQPKIALMYAIIAGHQSEMYQLFKKLGGTWVQFLWAILYSFYRQRLIQRILDIQKKRHIQPIQTLICLKQIYKIQINWDQLQTQCISSKNFDHLSFCFIRDFLTKDEVNIQNLQQQLEQFRSDQQYKQGVIKVGTLLYKLDPTPKFKQLLINISKYSAFEEQVLPIISQSKQQVISHYFQRQTPIDPINIQKFKDSKLKDEITRKFLKNNQKKSLQAVKNLSNNIQKIVHLSQSLQNNNIKQIRSTFQVLKPLLNLYFAQPSVQRYSQIFNNYNSVIQIILSQQYGFDHFQALEKSLINPFPTILNVRPPQHNKKLLMSLISSFYENALYLIQSERFNNKITVYQKSKSMVESLNSYIHQVLTKDQVHKCLHKGLFPILIRDTSLINDLRVD